MALPGRPFKRLGNLLGDAGPLLGKVAPTIATALGGPLAGAGVAALGKTLVGDDFDAEDGGMMERLRKTLAAPSADQLAAMQATDQAFKLEMADKGIEVDRLIAGDRADARGMAREMVKAGKHLWPQVAISGIVLLAFNATLWWLLGNSIPEGNENMINYMVGQLSGFATSAVAFWLASSFGSRTKDDHPGFDPG
ncbi:MAG: hypothetical protein AAGA68_27400 [Pseudomonadota bacterium]